MEKRSKWLLRNYSWRLHWSTSSEDEDDDYTVDDDREEGERKWCKTDTSLIMRKLDDDMESQGRQFQVTPSSSYLSWDMRIKQDLRLKHLSWPWLLWSLFLHDFPFFLSWTSMWVTWVLGLKGEHKEMYVWSKRGMLKKGEQIRQLISASPKRGWFWMRNHKN